MAEQVNQIVKKTPDLLLERELIEGGDIIRAEELAAKNSVFFEDAILSLGLPNEEEMVKAIGEVYSLPYFDARGKKIPFIVLSKFPEEIAKKYNMLVFEIVDDQLLKVAIARPWDPVTKKALEFIRQKNHLTIDPYIISKKGLDTIIEQYKNPVMVEKVSGEEIVEKVPKDVEAIEPGAIPPAAQKEKEEVVTSSAPGMDIANGNIAELIKEDINSEEDLRNIIKNSTIPRIVAAIIKYAVLSRASDIHVEPIKESDTRIRYRVDGILKHIADIPRKDHAALVSRIKISAKLKIDEQRVPQDGRIDLKFNEKAIDLRVSTFPTIDGEKVVMRILDKSGGIITIEQLGITGRAFDLFLEAIKIPHGILLVTGPTGSGKTTTLYAAIERINKEGVNIVTLEDPIEYQMKGVNQSQVKPYIGYTFATGLRSILRQDPNIIMVGEIRDRETAEMAVQSALTGHLVLSTLHTNNAAGAIPRLIDMGVEPFLISSTLHTIVAQRLVRKLCDECKQLVDVPQVVLEDMRKEFSAVPDQYKTGIELDINQGKYYKAVGCPQCGNSGYRGRFGVFEVLRVSEEIQKLAINRVSASEILQQALKEGMITMKQDGVIKVLKGMTTMEEVYRVTSL